MSEKNIAIIGAGLAGITLARGLAGSANVRVFEKSGRVGGRMAQRGAEGFAFDHGAQYFTARGEELKRLVEDAIIHGAVATWPAAVASLPEQRPATTQGKEVRYVGRPAMNSLVAHLAKDIDVRFDTEIKSIERELGGWTMTWGNGTRIGPFDLVIATAPSPQTSKLLPHCFSGHDHLGSTRMSGCFTLMVGLAEADLLSFEAARIDHPVLSWIAVDSTKPGRPAKTSLVVHSRNDWAEAHIEAELDWIRTAMLAALMEVLGKDFAAAAWIDLHRWRFANVERAVGMPFLFDRENGLAACGDWCLGNRVEAAFESAVNLAQAVQEWIVQD